MNKIVKIMVLSIAALALLTAPSLGAITADEAQKIAEQYSKEGEAASIYGPYTLQNKSYYYVEYRTGKELTGVNILDMSTGEVVSDEKTVHHVLFTVYGLINVSNKTIEAARLDARHYRELASYYEQSNQNLSNIFNEIAEAYEGIEAVETDVVLNVRMSYENAERLAQYSKDLEKALNALDDEYKNDSVSDNISREVIENMIAEIETYIRNAQENMSDGSSDDKNETPGFSLIAAVSVLFAVGFFIRKQKK